MTAATKGQDDDVLHVSRLFAGLTLHRTRRRHLNWRGLLNWSVLVAIILIGLALFAYLILFLLAVIGRFYLHVG